MPASQSIIPPLRSFIEAAGFLSEVFIHFVEYPASCNPVRGRGHNRSVFLLPVLAWFIYLFPVYRSQYTHCHLFTIFYIPCQEKKQSFHISGIMGCFHHVPVFPPGMLYLTIRCAIPLPLTFLFCLEDIPVGVSGDKHQPLVWQRWAWWVWHLNGKHGHRPFNFSVSSSDGFPPSRLLQPNLCCLFPFSSPQVQVSRKLPGTCPRQMPCLLSGARCYGGFHLPG